MERFPYRGTWIACGTYAFLQASGLWEDLLIEIENCAGATFGMKSLKRELDYTRILTPFRDFHCGIDKAAHLWGVVIKHEILESKESFRPEVLEREAEGFVIGPVNMEGLKYLVLPQQYHLSDHFFAVRRCANGKYVLYDSEGIAGMDIDAEQIKDWLNITSIPEANERVHIRTLYKVGDPVSRKERLDYEIQVATKNFRLAGESGQGAKAFLLCRDVVEEDQSVLSRWRESFFYNMNYVIQRRLMMIQLIERVAQTDEFRPDRRLRSLIMGQIQTAGECLKALERVDIKRMGEKLNLLYETEIELTLRWEDWIK